MISYKEFSTELIERVKEIYAEEGWKSYLDNDRKLVRAFQNSLYILGAFEEENLIGFIRCVGDGEHIVIVQDLIVDRCYQKQGIGSMLFKMIWNKYKDVRMFQVVTDLADEVDNHFYQSFGMKPLVEGHMIAYFR
ncbi:MAG: GNAT family N-acetyltransferase [Lachnospiraceae bacterium]|nr:GNAT family N-acetyltransferase [Lachnospiraceae bacterium]